MVARDDKKTPQTPSVPPPYNWEAKRPTEDTDAAIEQVLKSMSRGNR